MAEDEVKENANAQEGEENPEGEGAEGEEGSKPKKSKKKLIIIIVLAVLILGGAGAGAMLMMGGDDEHISLEEGAVEEDGEHGADQKPAESVFMDMPDMVINLNSQGRRAHFINLKLTLELSSAEDVPLIEAQMPRIIDSFNTYLREMRREDLQGSAGIYRLEHELMLRMQKTLTEGRVLDILFREIIIQ